MRYGIERLGCISGKTEHESLDAAIAHLQLEYPHLDYISRDGLAGIVDEGKVDAILACLKNIFDIRRWFPQRRPLVSEDDIILIWEITDMGEQRVVWHLSGWRWDEYESRYALPQETSPDNISPYKSVVIACY